MLKSPMEGRRNGVYWHILQTHSAAEVAFNRYVGMFPRESWIYTWDKRPNESQKEVFLTGGRMVGFKSGENYQDLRTETLDGAILDECRQQDRILWTQVVRPMLARHSGWCDFYSTPNGYDWFYDLEMDHKDNPEWEFFHAPSSEAWWWTPEEIESARQNMTEAEFAQEIMAEYRIMTTGLAYYNFGEESMVMQNPFAKPGDEWSPHLPIGVAMDFNVNPMCWTLGQHKVKDFYWGDEIHLPTPGSGRDRADTDDAAECLAAKVRGHAAGVEIVGDASGHSTSSKAKAGATDYRIIETVMRKYNIPFRVLTPNKNPGVKDRVNTMNLTLRDGSGVRHMFVNRARCPNLIRDFQRVVLKANKANTFEIDKSSDPRVTHASDGVGYFVCVKAARQFDVRPTAIKVLWR